MTPELEQAAAAMRVHPGEFIQEELDARRWTRAGFAAKCGEPVAWVDRLIEGSLAVTPEIAAELALSLGASEAFWLNLQSEVGSHGCVCR